MSDVHDMSYYKKCMMGGILSCGITHTIVCPLDIVKCRMQVSILTNSISQWSKTEIPQTRQISNLSFNSCRLTQVCTPELVTDLPRSRLPKDLRDSPSDGPQLLLVTPLKVSESSVSMKSSRMFTDPPLVITLPSTKLSDSPSPLPALRLSPMSSSAHGKP